MLILVTSTRCFVFLFRTHCIRNIVEKIDELDIILYKMDINTDKTIYRKGTEVLPRKDNFFICFIFLFKA